MKLIRILCPKGIEEIEQLVLFAFGATIAEYVVLARSLIISSNRETCIVPMYHEVEIVFATCIIIDQATGRNWRGILDRRRRSPFSSKNIRHAEDYSRIVHPFQRSDTIFNSLSGEYISLERSPASGRSPRTRSCIKLS